MLTETDVLLGVLHLAICITSFLLNAANAVAIHYLGDIHKTLSYRILQQLNVCYVIHITVHIGVGISIFLGVSHAHYTSKVLGAFAHLGWFGIMFLNFLLCLERVNVTVCNGYFRLGRISFIVVSCLAWLPGIVTFCLDLTPYLTFYFNPTEAQWDFAGPLTEQFLQFSQIVTFIILPATFILYLVIYLFLAKQRRMAHITLNRPKSELNGLYASTLMFLYPFTEEAIYFVVRTAQNDRFWWRFAIHMLWISIPLFCHVVQLIFNRSIRRQLAKFVKIVNEHKTTVMNVRSSTRAISGNAP